MQQACERHHITMQKDPLSLKHAKVYEYEVLFTKQKTQKSKAWHDGILKYYSFNKKIQLFDETNSMLADEFINKPSLLFDGNRFCISNYMIEISVLINKFERDLSDAFKSKSQKASVYRPKTESVFNSQKQIKTGSASNLNTSIKQPPYRKESIKPVGLTKRPHTAISVKQELSTRPTISFQPHPTNILENHDTVPAIKKSSLIPNLEAQLIISKYNMLNSKTRFHSNLRSSPLLISLPDPKVKSANSLSSLSNETLSKPKIRSGGVDPSTPSQRKNTKKKKPVPKGMKLHGPPRPIEIPKALLQDFEPMGLTADSNFDVPMDPHGVKQEVLSESELLEEHTGEFLDHEGPQMPKPLVDYISVGEDANVGKKETKFEDENLEDLVSQEGKERKQDLNIEQLGDTNPTTGKVNGKEIDKEKEKGKVNERSEEGGKEGQEPFIKNSLNAAPRHILKDKDPKELNTTHNETAKPFPQHTSNASLVTPIATRHYMDENGNAHLEPSKKRKKFSSHIEIYASDSSQISDHDFSDSDDDEILNQISNNHYKSSNPSVNDLSADNITVKKKSLGTTRRATIAGSAMTPTTKISQKYTQFSNAIHDNMTHNQQRTGMKLFGRHTMSPSMNSCSTQTKTYNYSPITKKGLPSVTKLGLTMSKRMLINSGSIQNKDELKEATE